MADPLDTTMQLTVEVKLADVPKTLTATKRSRKWRKAIDVLRADPRFKTAVKTPAEFIPLPLYPNGGVLGWYVERGGIQFRCLAQYRMTPLPSGFIGRVDVAWR